MPLDNILNAPILAYTNPHTQMQTAVMPWLHPQVQFMRDREGNDEERRHGLLLLQEGRHRLAMPGVWIKGHDEMPIPDVLGGMAFCARGVIRYLSARLGLIARQAFIALAAEVPPTHRLEGDPECSVPNYNDCPSTTRSDVLALFDRAIVRMEKQLEVA